MRRGYGRALALLAVTNAAMACAHGDAADLFEDGGAGGGPVVSTSHASSAANTTGVGTSATTGVGETTGVGTSGVTVAASSSSGGSLCGDNLIEPPEQCDGPFTGMGSCQSLGFAGGTLACSPSCTYDTSGCTNSVMCAHDTCTTGALLDANCDACVGQICNADPFCCTDSWDAACVDEVSSVCGLSTCGTATCGNGVVDPGEDCDGTNLDGSSCADFGFSGGTLSCSGCAYDTASCSNATCAHDVCTSGTSLANGCDTCVSQVCAVDSFCCATSWDSTCVSEAGSMCGAPCGTTGCTHDECTSGIALTDGCSACVSSICGSDPYCCDTEWDTICVDEASSTCGLACP